MSMRTHRSKPHFIALVDDKDSMTRSAMATPSQRIEEEYPTRRKQNKMDGAELMSRLLEEELDKKTLIRIVCQ